jgi:hypothetical protein
VEFGSEIGYRKNSLVGFESEKKSSPKTGNEDGDEEILPK